MPPKQQADDPDEEDLPTFEIKPPSALGKRKEPPTALLRTKPKPPPKPKRKRQTSPEITVEEEPAVDIYGLTPETPTGSPQNIASQESSFVEKPPEPHPRVRVRPERKRTVKEYKKKTQPLTEETLPDIRLSPVPEEELQAIETEESEGFLPSKKQYTLKTKPTPLEEAQEDIEAELEKIFRKPVAAPEFEPPSTEESSIPWKTKVPQSEKRVPPKEQLPAKLGKRPLPGLGEKEFQTPSTRREQIDIGDVIEFVESSFRKLDPLYNDLYPILLENLGKIPIITQEKQRVQQLIIDLKQQKLYYNVTKKLFNESIATTDRINLKGAMYRFYKVINGFSAGETINVPWSVNPFELFKELKSLVEKNWLYIARKILKTRTKILGYIDFIRNRHDRLKILVWDTMNDETKQHYSNLTKNIQELLTDKVSYLVTDPSLPRDLNKLNEYFEKVSESWHYVQQYNLAVIKLYQRLWQVMFTEPLLKEDSDEENLYDMKIKMKFTGRATIEKSKYDIQTIGFAGESSIAYNLTKEINPVESIPISNDIHAQIDEYKRIIGKSLLTIAFLDSYLEENVPTHIGEEFFTKTEFSILPETIIEATIYSRENEKPVTLQHLSKQEIFEYINGGRPLVRGQKWVTNFIQDPSTPEINPDDDTFTQKFLEDGFSYKVVKPIPSPDYLMLYPARQEVWQEYYYINQNIPGLLRIQTRAEEPGSSRATTRYSNIPLIRDITSEISEYPWSHYSTKLRKRFFSINMKNAHKTAFIQWLKDNPDKVLNYKTSQWFFTFNPNLPIRTLMDKNYDESSLKEYFIRWVDQMLPGYLNPSDKGLKVNMGIHNILSWKVLFAQAEEAPLTANIHVHALLQVDYAYLIDEEQPNFEAPELYLNYYSMQKMLEEDFSGVYLNAIKVKVPINMTEKELSDQRIRDYIRKANAMAKETIRKNNPHYTGTINRYITQVTRVNS